MNYVRCGDRALMAGLRPAMSPHTVGRRPPLHLLPGGEERLPAVHRLGEGVGQVHDPALASALTALHDHTGHLHQLHGALPVPQSLRQV